MFKAGRSGRIKSETYISHEGHWVSTATKNATMAFGIYIQQRYGDSIGIMVIGITFTLDHIGDREQKGVGFCMVKCRSSIPTYSNCTGETRSGRSRNRHCNSMINLNYSKRLAVNNSVLCIPKPNFAKTKR